MKTLFYQGAVPGSSFPIKHGPWVEGPFRATEACTSICGSPQAKPRGRSPGDTGGFLGLKPTAPKAPTDDKEMSDGLGSGFLCTPCPRPLLSSPDQAHVHTLTPQIHPPHGSTNHNPRCEPASLSTLGHTSSQFPSLLDTGSCFLLPRMQPLAAPQPHSRSHHSLKSHQPWRSRHSHQVAPRA